MYPRPGMERSGRGGGGSCHLGLVRCTTSVMPSLRYTQLHLRLLARNTLTESTSDL